MDTAFRLADSGIGAWISKRIPSLSASTRDPKRTFRFRRNLAAFAFFILAIGLAYWAEELARNNAIQDWDKAHAPDGTVWRHSLNSRGYQLLTDPQAMQKASRKLPMRLDATASVWISPDAQWITIFLNPDLPSPEQIYCLKCEPPFPEAWNPAGESWAGLNAALERIDAAALSRKTIENKKKSREDQDRREIHY